MLTYVVKSTCHPELDSGSVQRCELSVTQDRSRNRLARLAKNGTAKSVVFALCLRSLAQFGMTPTESVLCLVNRLSVRKCAFTMAEILLSLTIIGVVAAITLPSLTGNINERTWNTQRKALYARFSQAIALMPALNGFGSYSASYSNNSLVVAQDNAAMTFVTDGLAKVLKINNICEYNKIQDCGFQNSYTNMAGSKKITPLTLKAWNNMFFDRFEGWQNPQKYIDTKAAAFETQNGESILLIYNPQCVSEDSGLAAAPKNYHQYISYYAQPYMCANFIYDLNGRKGPNTVGKDMGWITALFPIDSEVVAPMPQVRDAEFAKTLSDANRNCAAQDKYSRLPNINEFSSLFYNRDLIGLPMGGVAYWTNSTEGSDSVWRHDFDVGLRFIVPKTYVSTTGACRCIKRF